MEAFDKELSKISGLTSLKSQLQSWAKQLALDQRRRDLGHKVGERRPPHMAFLGNPGTGKTMIARTMAKLLHMLRVIPTDKVVEVQRTDLVARYIGQTGPKTREKIKSAEGGVLFVDEAYRLMPHNSIRNSLDFGLEALEEIMSFMDTKQVVVIFAGYREQMDNVISANPGFRRRVTKFFYFDDFTCQDLANILVLKMTVANQVDQTSPLYGFKLHQSCTVAAIAETVERESTEKQRRELNGGLVDTMLVSARESLDKRLDVECEDLDSLLTITLEDLAAGLLLMRQTSTDQNPEKIIKKEQVDKEKLVVMKNKPKDQDENLVVMKKKLKDEEEKLVMKKKKQKDMIRDALTADILLHLGSGLALLYIVIFIFVIFFNSSILEYVS